MPQALKTKKVSAAEAQDAMAARHGGAHVREIGGQTAVIKASTEKAGYNAEKRSARFVMTSEVEDRYGDVVMTKGVDTTQFERNPVALMGHSHRVSVGNWANVQKLLSGRPRRMEGDLILLPSGGPVREVEETAWLLENDGLRACSIGFIPNWNEIEFLLNEEEEWTGGIRFLESELIECSPCIIPANPQALMKHADGAPSVALELLEKTFDEWERNPLSGLLMPKKEFEAAFKRVEEEVNGEKRYYVVPKQGITIGPDGIEIRTKDGAVLRTAGGDKPEENLPDAGTNPSDETIPDGTKDPSPNAEGDGAPDGVVTSDEVPAPKDGEGDADGAAGAPEGTVTSDDVPTDKTLRLTLGDGTAVGEITLTGDPDKDADELERMLEQLDVPTKFDKFMDTIRLQFLNLMSKAPPEEPVEPKVAAHVADFAKARAAAAIAMSKNLH